MAAFQKFNSFVEYLLIAKAIDFDADTFKVGLSSGAPNATHSVKGDLTEIGGSNGYTAGGIVTTLAHNRSGGTSTITGSDVVWTGTGTMGTFRYPFLYDDTPTSPADPLIGFWDYGGNVTLLDTETFTVDFGTILTLV